MASLGVVCWCQATGTLPHLRTRRFGPGSHGRIVAWSAGSPASTPFFYSAASAPNCCGALVLSRPGILVIDAFSHRVVGWRPTHRRLGDETATSVVRTRDRRSQRSQDAVISWA